MADVTHAAKILAVIGASGSGKSLFVKQLLRRQKPKRLIVWDADAEYGAHGLVFTDRAALADAVRKAGAAGSLKAIFQPQGKLKDWPELFGWVCFVAYAWENCTLVCEELGDVTKPGWAPDGWSTAARKGRKRGLSIIGLSQRPAAMDKTFFTLATVIHCGRLNFDADLKTMAGVLAVPPGDLSALLPLEYIERDTATGMTQSGKIKIR